MRNLLTTLFIIVFVVSCGTENNPTYTLTTSVSPSEGGTITPTSGEYSEGEVVELKGTPSSDGWRFVRWEGDWSSTQNPTSVTMNKDYSVVGVFEKRNYPLTITIEGQGTVEERIVLQKSTEYPYETVVELTPIPSEGWEFVSWGGGAIGTSVPLVVTVTSELNIVGSFFEKLKDGEVRNPVTGRIWMDRNLGASRVATSSRDEQAYGDLYQWGRGADGHHKRNSTTTTTLSSTDQPGHASFILTSASPNDWHSPRNDNLWQGVNGINNPCPVGYRLPTEAEWDTERASWSSNDAAGAFASPLKLPLAGLRSGSLINVGSFGYYWSSSVSGAAARYLDFTSSSAVMGSIFRAYGFSARCLRD